MVVTIGLFVLGILMLWGGSENVTRNIGPLARSLGVKELVITVLGVSVLTSLPEMTVSLFALAKGDPAISIGNILGSNFVTLTFVTALCALVRPIKIHDEIQSRESSWMILSSSMVLLLAMDGRLSRSEGLLLILLYCPYVFSVIKTARKGVEKTGPVSKQKSTLWTSAGAVLGIILILAGSKIALDSGEILGRAFGISPLVMGVLLFAFGTSLPELSISLSATFKNQADVSIGEVYASNIFTQLVVLGLCCLIRPIEVAPALVSFVLPFLILAAVVIQIFVTSGRILNRIEALGLIGFYIVFVISQFRPLPSLERILGF